MGCVVWGVCEKIVETADEIEGDIVSDFESRRFTAVLDAMDERLDPEKIERTIIAKYLVENEPVLIGDLLPEVMFYLPQRQRRCRANAGHVDIQACSGCLGRVL